MGFFLPNTFLGRRVIRGSISGHWKRNDDYEEQGNPELTVIVFMSSRAEVTTNVAI